MRLYCEAIFFALCQSSDACFMLAGQEGFFYTLEIVNVPLPSMQHNFIRENTCQVKHWGLFLFQFYQTLTSNALHTTTLSKLYPCQGYILSLTIEVSSGRFWNTCALVTGNEQSISDFSGFLLERFEFQHSRIKPAHSHPPSKHSRENFVMSLWPSHFLENILENVW